MIRRVLLVAIACAALCTVTGCDRLTNSGASSEPAASTTRAAFELAVGDQGYTLTPAGDGYTLGSKSGGAAGKVKVESDRVKVKAAAEAKVKLKDYGFKVYDAADAEVLKGKRRGAGWKIQRADGSELGALDERGGALGQSTVAVERQGERWQVMRDGAAVGSASASLPGVAAALLGLTELTPEQRIALVVFHKEIVR